MSGKRVLVELALVVAALVLAVYFLVSAAGTVAAWLTPMISPELDKKLGQMVSAQQGFLRTPCTDPELGRFIDGIGTRLVKELGPTPFTYRIVVVDGPEVNAFALPGGHVTLQYGLIESARTGDEIAAVLAHEIQHVELRHGTRGILREVGGWAAISAVFGDTSLQLPAFLLADASFLKNSREQESEADAGGLALLVKARIDPRGLSTFFERLARSAPTPPALLSTHPDPGDRADAARRAAAEIRNAEPLPKPHGLRCAR